ncbi:MAG: amidohydrolase family protein [Opitutaceae bacterium]
MTLGIMLRRLKDFKLPKKIEKIVVKQLEKVIKSAGELTDTEQIFTDLIKELNATDVFKEMLGRLKPSEIDELKVIGISQLEDLAIGELTQIFDILAIGFERDARKKNIADFLGFIRIALMPSIRDVTNTLMEQVKKNDAVVALTLDITKDGKDSKFPKQLDETSKMVLAYPGRILPFVAVNPRRTGTSTSPSYFELMEQALAGMGFVGVKLYPSLGYEIKSDAMRRVYAYCGDSNRNVPILVHCTPGGFNYSPQWSEQSNPENWVDILEEFPNLKICFGHFGDDTSLIKPDIEQETSWTNIIIDLIRNPAYPNVYADISFHTSPMAGGESEANYKRNILHLLNDPQVKDRILFGTDYFLVRQQLKEKNHWKYFEKLLGTDAFAQIAEKNPARYLGLPQGQTGAEWSIRNYISFVARASRVERKPASWLVDATRKTMGETFSFRVLPLVDGWEWNNTATRLTYKYFSKKQMKFEVEFEQAATMPLTHMNYWRRKRTMSAAQWSQQLQQIASNLHLYFKAAGAKPIGKVSTSKGKIVTALRKGDQSLGELAKICDNNYNFEGESE